MTFIFGPLTLWLIDFTQFYWFKGYRAQNKGLTNFYKYCDLTKKYIQCISLFFKIGNWGFKRYHRDGYGCVLEDLKKNQRFYEDGATQHFEHVESEWPVFHTFMIIDGLFKNNDSQVEKHQRLLKPLLKYTEKGGMIYSFCRKCKYLAFLWFLFSVY